MGYHWETGRYAYHETLLKQEKVYKLLLEEDNKRVREGAKRDMDRIAARKEQFSTGDYDMDEWSDFSVISEDLEEEFYFPPGVDSEDQNELVSTGTMETSRPLCSIEQMLTVSFTSSAATEKGKSHLPKEARPKELTCTRPG